MRVDRDGPQQCLQDAHVWAISDAHLAVEKNQQVMFPDPNHRVWNDIKLASQRANKFWWRCIAQCALIFNSNYGRRESLLLLLFVQTRRALMGMGPYRDLQSHRNLYNQQQQQKQ